jgi:hypothetical protein
MNGWLFGNSGMRTGMAETRQPRSTRARAVQIRREVELLYEQADQAPPNYIDHIYRHDLEDKHNWRKPQQN